MIVCFSKIFFRMKKISSISLYFLFFSFLLFSFSGCALFETGDARLHMFHTVILDPGHGGCDPGARAVKGVNEKQLSLDIAQRVKPLLEAEGYRVIMTRTNDTFIPLETRTAIANAHSNAIFVSIHFNASPKRHASGVETYYYCYGSEPLAAALFQELCRQRRCPRRGVKRAVFYVLSHNHCPATLLELGFVSNRQENALLQTPKMRQQLAKQIAAGIERARTI